MGAGRCCRTSLRQECNSRASSAGHSYSPASAKGAPTSEAALVGRLHAAPSARHPRRLVQNVRKQPVVTPLATTELVQVVKGSSTSPDLEGSDAERWTANWFNNPCPALG